MANYKIKEMYYTLQGEGAQAGRAAVFCRFTGCNLWSGREEDRHKAICQFCDTDFWGTDGRNGGQYTAQELSKKVRSLWPDGQQGIPYVVCTGGEPLLQLDEELIGAFHEQGLEVGVETNGTLPAPASLDWICVSPKANAVLVQTTGQELKLVFPQPDLLPDMLPTTHFQHYFLQPMDGPQVKDNIQQTIQYCMEHPQWRLSLQTHKMIGID